MVLWELQRVTWVELPLGKRSKLWCFEAKGGHEDLPRGCMPRREGCEKQHAAVAKRRKHAKWKRKKKQCKSMSLWE